MNRQTLLSTSICSPNHGAAGGKVSRPATAAAAFSNSEKFRPFDPKCSRKPFSCILPLCFRESIYIYSAPNAVYMGVWVLVHSRLYAAGDLVLLSENSAANETPAFPDRSCCHWLPSSVPCKRYGRCNRFHGFLPPIAITLLSRTISSIFKDGPQWLQVWELAAKHSLYRATTTIDVRTISTFIRLYACHPWCLRLFAGLWLPSPPSNDSYCPWVVPRPHSTPKYNTT